MQKDIKQQELPVMRYSDSPPGPVESLLARFGLQIRVVAAAEPRPGSFWGEEEAGLVGTTLLLRKDTPLHSILHETCHYICMDAERRAGLDTDAGGDYDEENGLCYLQIVLADEIPGFGSARMMADMDSWGYTFRLGSARAWFEEDARDARAWLRSHGILDETGQPAFMVRT